MVVLAVKPQDIEALLAEISAHVSEDQTILSVVAAIPTSLIEQRLGVPVAVVRAMPNTPSVVHEGMAGIAAGKHADEEHTQLAREVLEHVGRVVVVPESYLDAVTAISGSGPAYFALLAEAMIEAGILLGLVARDLHRPRRADDARFGKASPGRRHASRWSCARWSRHPEGRPFEQYAFSNSLECERHF